MKSLQINVRFYGTYGYVSIHILLHMLVLLHVNNFFSGIYVRLFKFREDFYSQVFNFAIFLQSRKTRNLNLLPRSQSVLRWTLGRGKSRYEISLLQKKERFIVFLFFQIISFTAIDQSPGPVGNSSRANRIRRGAGARSVRCGLQSNALGKSWDRGV